MYLGSDGPYYGNSDGMLRVAMPGVVPGDYSVGVEYLGRMTDTNDKDNAVFNLTFGADVTTVKYALVKEGEDLNKTESGIIDGSVELQRYQRLAEWKFHLRSLAPTTW